MKIASMIIGILGAVLGIILGITWMSDYFSMQQQINAAGAIAKSLSNSLLQAQMAELSKLYIASFVLTIGGVIAVVATIMINKLKEKTAYVLIAVPVIAAILAPKSLVFTFLMPIAAIMVFVKRKSL